MYIFLQIRTYNFKVNINCLRTCVFVRLHELSQLFFTAMSQSVESGQETWAMTATAAAVVAVVVAIVLAVYAGRWAPK